MKPIVFHFGAVLLGFPYGTLKPLLKQVILEFLYGLFLTFQNVCNVPSVSAVRYLLIILLDHHGVIDIANQYNILLDVRWSSYL